MVYVQRLTSGDQELSRSLAGFLPDEVFDIHTHPYHPAHFPRNSWPFLKDAGTLGCAEHREALMRYMPVKRIHGLYFGMPQRLADRSHLNQWVAEEVSVNGSSLSRALMVVSPEDERSEVEAALRQRLFCGIKVYHCYASRADTMNASIREYAPEWMWALLNETRGILMLHIVRDGAIADSDNQSEIRRLSRRYPGARVVLAHVARSFNYRHARKGLEALTDLDNVYVDTSAICELETFRAALKRLGPRRILWGSDFAVSEMRGRCVGTGAHFFWLHPEIIQKGYRPPTVTGMTLVGLESLMCLREACEDSGLGSSDVRDIFYNNAIRFLEPHLPEGVALKEESGPALWSRARTVISSGTGLLSKRAEMFGVKDWPAYFSRCSGCEVWDVDGRRYVDFVGGIGGVLLGYADEDVSRAVQKRLDAGTYCSLVSPQEVTLAARLLELHPWAGKVRYARGGGEAMSMAVRIARSATGRNGIAFCGYHGWHDWYLAANLGDTRALDGHLLPGLPPLGVPRALKGTSVPFKFNDWSSFESALEQLGEDIAAVVMEPMRSEPPKDDFLKKIAERCRAAGAVMVVDEITSGLRYGFPGALSKTGVEPDMVVYAKAMSNGFPFAAIVGRDETMNAADNSFISSSYWTDGVGPAAALAVLDKMARLHVHETVWKRGEEFQSALKAVASAYPKLKLVVDGMPVSPRLNFKLDAHSGKAKAMLTEKMLARGFLVSSVIYLMHAHTEQHVKNFVEAIDQVLREMHIIVGCDQLSSYSGSNGNTGFARLA